MTQLLSPDPDRSGNNDISVAEFTDQAHRYGWRFWRGVMLGFASMAVIGWLAFGATPFTG